MTQLTERDMRQRDIIPPDRLTQYRPTVVGVGAIGRQVALQLAAIGVPWLQLIDPDTVEEVNLAPQGFLQDDLGRSKVEAVGDLCHQVNHQLEMHEHPERFRRSMDIGDVVFLCVDAIQTRRHIWEAVKDRVDFLADGRMTAEVVRVLAITDEQSREYYPTTLFQAEEAVQGSCTAKSTIFTANIAAGLMLEQFSRWLRRLPVDPDLTLNLLASELTCAPTDKSSPAHHLTTAQVTELRQAAVRVIMNDLAGADREQAAHWAEYCLKGRDNVQTYLEILDWNNLDGEERTRIGLSFDPTGH